MRNSNIITTQLIILPNGTHAIEINELGEKPIRSDYATLLNDEQFADHLEIWKEEEFSLKEYKIVGAMVDGEFVDYNPGNPKEEEVFLQYYPVGTIHTFEVNQEEGTCIVV